MNTHDILSVNIDDSKTFAEAIEKFREEDHANYTNKGDTEDGLLDAGFEYGFIAAAKILTGFKAGYED